MTPGISPPWIVRRYVAAEYTRWFLFCIVGFGSIIVVVDLFDKSGKFITKHASLGAVMRYTLYALPEFVSLLIPAAALLAIMIALSGMAKRNEITAILAGGIGRRSIVAPMALIALLACAAEFTLSEYVVPEANAQRNYVLDVEISGKPHAQFSDRRNHWFFVDGGFLRVGVIDRRPHAEDPALPPEVTLHDVTWLKAGDETHPPVRVEASAAHFDATLNRWVLSEGRTAVVDSSGLLKIVPAVGNELAISLAPTDLSDKVAKTEEWGVRDLQKIIRDRKRLGQNVIKETVDLHQRFAFPLAGFVMALLGAPFAFREHRRGGAAAGLFFGIVIGFSYFLVMATALSFGKSGSIPPVFAAWLPVVMFGGTGIYLTATLDLL